MEAKRNLTPLSSASMPDSTARRRFDRSEMGGTDSLSAGLQSRLTGTVPRGVRRLSRTRVFVSERYAFDGARGVFSGWNEERKAYTDTSSWGYELGPDGFARVDPTLTHPRSVFQVMKSFYARYTPEVVSNICGCGADEFVKETAPT